MVRKTQVPGQADVRLHRGLTRQDPAKLRHLYASQGWYRMVVEGDPPLRPADLLQLASRNYT